jgi:hypothetical protein
VKNSLIDRILERMPRGVLQANVFGRTNRLTACSLFAALTVASMSAVADCRYACTYDDAPFPSVTCWPISPWAPPAGVPDMTCIKHDYNGSLTCSWPSAGVEAAPPEDMQGPSGANWAAPGAMQGPGPPPGSMHGANWAAPGAMQGPGPPPGSMHGGNWAAPGAMQGPGPPPGGMQGPSDGNWGPAAMQEPAGSLRAMSEPYPHRGGGVGDEWGPRGEPRLPPPIVRPSAPRMNPPERSHIRSNSTNKLPSSPANEPYDESEKPRKSPEKQNPDLPQPKGGQGPR